jgi:hypothetical protein
VEDVISYLILITVIIIRYGYLYLVIKYIQNQINKSKQEVATLTDPVGSNQHIAKHTIWIINNLSLQIPFFTLLYFIIDMIAVALGSFLLSYLV